LAARVRLDGVLYIAPPQFRVAVQHGDTVADVAASPEELGPPAQEIRRMKPRQPAFRSVYRIRKDVWERRCYATMLRNRSRVRPLPKRRRKRLGSSQSTDRGLGVHPLTCKCGQDGSPVVSRPRHVRATASRH
jgi:hypothetical protein